MQIECTSLAGSTTLLCIRPQCINVGEGRHIALRIRHIHHDVSSSAVYLSIGAGATVSAASVGTAWRWRVRGQPIRLSTVPAKAGRAVAVDPTSA